jgi:HD superfamily phosphodiesterase
MNDIDKNPNYKQIYEFAKNKFNNTKYFNNGPFDETYYSLRVYESAKEIYTKIGKKAKKEQLLVSAILHDIGKIKLKTSLLFNKIGILKNFSDEWHKHPKLGIPIARKYLLKIGHSNEFVDEVCYLIENHANRGDELKDKSLELKILQDADLIADIGFAGFIRPFLHSGKFSRSIEQTIRFVEKDDRTKGGDLLNLSVSKSIAKREMNTKSRLVKEILKEIDSDLL